MFANQGENDEFNVKVSLKIARASGTGTPIPLSKTVPRVAKGETTVAIPLTKEPPIGTALNIDSTSPRSGEEKVDNNKATYPSLFDQGLASSPVSDSRTLRGSLRSQPPRAAVVALIWLLVLSLRFRRVRAAQRLVLGEHGQRDLVEHASELQQAFEALHARVDEVSEHLAERMSAAEDRLDGAIAYRRWCAMTPTTRCPATSRPRSRCSTPSQWVVLSSIVHRDQARLYCKQVHGGRGEHQLSPEEEEAVRLALAGEVVTVIWSAVKVAYLGLPGR